MASIHVYPNDSSKFYTPGHILGSCYMNHKDKIIYLPMPKNASTTLKQILTDRGYIYIPAGHVAPESYRVFSIIREPVERYISGVAEYWRRYSFYGKDPWNNPVEKCWDSFVIRTVNYLREHGIPPVYDEHTVPQRHFVVPGLIPDYRIAMDDRFEERLNGFFKDFLSTPLQKYESIKLNCGVPHMLQMLRNNFTEDELNLIDIYCKPAGRLFQEAAAEETYIKTHRNDPTV